MTSRPALPKGMGLLLLLLAPRHRDVFAGDLLEEYEHFIVPSRSPGAARRWLWWQAIRGTLVGGAHRMYDWVKGAGTAMSGGQPNGNGRGGARHMDRLWQDLKYAVRGLRSSPGFTLIAITSLAIAIGANTAIFTVVNGVMLRGTSMTDPESMVELYLYREASPLKYEPVSWPDYDEIARLTTVFEGATAWEMFYASTQVPSGSEPVLGELVAGNFFSLLGILPALGRGFLPEEDLVPGQNPVVVLSHAYWQNRYGSDPDVLGQAIKLNGLDYTIVGVAPRDFAGMMPGMVMDMWAPSMMMDQISTTPGSSPKGEARRLSPSSQSAFMKARLLPGVTPEQANAAMAALAIELEARVPENWKDGELRAIPSLDVAVHPLADRVLVPMVILLMSVVGMLLLIACTNLASFLLARGADRKSEIALRIALGAGRRRLVAQLLTETLLLASVGGALGLGLATWLVKLVVRFQPPLAIPVNLDLAIDGTVLTFCFAVTLGTGLLFGLLPALRSTRLDVAPVLKDESGSVTGGRRGGMLRKGLVVGQVAVSLVLLVGSGLFVRALFARQAVDPGFHAPQAAMIGVEMATSGYSRDEAEAALRELSAQALADPGIDQVALASHLPLSATLQMNTFEIPGFVDPERPEGPSIDVLTVGPAYFDLLEIPILQGRGFEASDTRSSAPAVVISQAMAERYFAGRSPIGAQLRRKEEAYTVVGVARDTKVRTLGEEPRPLVYYPLSQRYSSMVTLVAQGQADAALVLGTLERLVRSYDRDIVVMSKNTMDGHLGIMLFAPRMAAMILALSGGLALLLAGVGLYGVVSYSVASRTREVGIRMSLGADAWSVRRMVIRGGLTMVALGSAIGLVLAFALSKLVSGFLFGVSGTDPVTFVGVPLVLGGLAFLAAFVPAHRASRVAPVTALRGK